MSQIVEFRLESGESVFVEATGGGPARAKGGKDAIEKASETFETALEKVRPAAQALVSAFQSFNEPDEMGLEFGIQLKSGSNVFVFTGEGSASFKISLKWKNPKG